MAEKKKGPSKTQVAAAKRIAASRKSKRGTHFIPKGTSLTKASKAIAGGSKDYKFTPARAKALANARKKKRG